MEKESRVEEEGRFDEKHGAAELSERALRCRSWCRCGVGYAEGRVDLGSEVI
jgi:hypothetical protein